MHRTRTGIALGGLALAAAASVALAQAQGIKRTIL
jgi:hypothetical protein